MKKIITHIKQPTFELSDTPLMVETEEVEVADEYDLSYKFKWTTKPRIDIKNRSWIERDWSTGPKEIVEKLRQVRQEHGLY